MKKRLINILAIAFLLSLASCFGQHNQAVVEGVNQDSQRIYGDRDGEPRQLNNEYPEDETGETADRIANIREKFFPE